MHEHANRQTRRPRSTFHALAALAVSVALAAGCMVGPAASRSATASEPSRPSANPTTLWPSPTATRHASDTVRPTATVAPTRTPDPATPQPTVRPPVTPNPTAKPPAPTPKPTASRPTAAPASKVVTNGSRTGNDVALTFDMGGRVEDAVAIMDYLIAHRIHATVFMTGSMANNPWHDDGRQVLRMIDAHPDLFTLGNHSYSHPDFRDLSASQILDELRRTETALGTYCSQDLKPFFRPPSGAYDADSLVPIGTGGYRYTVMWDVDTIDWRPVKFDPPGPTTDEIVDKVMSNVRGGSIVLMHLGGYNTYEALPRIVDGLDAAGYDFVNLDEMFPN